MLRETLQLIARKELVDMSRDFRFRVSALVVCLLLATALITGFLGREAYERQRMEAVGADRQAWIHQGESNPHSAAHFGRYAFKPLLPSALFDKGLDSHLGVAIYIEGHAQNPLRHRPAEDMTALSRFGELTAAAVLQMLLPLLIILLTFHAFSGEREQGTLKLVLSLGVPPKTLLAGKALGIVLALLALLVPATLLGVALMTSSVDAQAVQTGSRFAILTVAYLGYLLAYVALALGVSALASTSRRSLLVLLGIWMSITLLIPRAGATVAEGLYPTPTLAEMRRQIDEDMKKGVDGHGSSGEREEALKRQLMKKYNVTSEKDLPINLDGFFLQEGEEHGNVVFDQRFGELSALYGRQSRILHVGAVLSPLLALRSLSMSVSGTDRWHHQQFANAAEQYRRTWVKRLNEDLTYNSRTGANDYKVGRSFWEATPDFQYAPPTLAHALRTQTWSGVVLGAWFVIASAFAWLSVRRISAIEEVS
jgi:ABC-2 type transport system permease protein